MATETRESSNLLTAESSRPPEDVGPDQHLLSTLWARRGNADRPLLVVPDGDDWRPIDEAEIVDRVVGLAAGLVALGLEPGDRVAVMSPTRLEWTLVDLAVLAAGGVVVPIYETSASDQAGSIIADAEPRVAFVDNSERAGVLADADADGLLEHTLVFDDGGLDRLAEAGTDDHRDEVERRVDALSGDDIASIVYTSGTTGEPKGCVLTHHNLVFTSRQVLVHLDDVISEDDSTVLFLPMAHIFTRVVQYVCLEAGIQVAFARSIDDLPDDLRSFRPTFLLAVPRVFEKVYRSAERQATGIRSRVFDLAVASGQRWAAKERPGPFLRLQRAVFDRLVYSKLRAGVGGRVRFCVSGGAPLNPALGRFFHAAGITILEGYGLTETSAPAAVNTPEHLRIGSVGRPIPGVSIRIADDGELLIRGDSVISGYHNNDEATKDAFVDGWFRTGDLGEIDDDGFVVVSDRKKELIVTASGKNVSPAPIEQRIQEHPLVSHAMVIGDDRPFLAALVTLDPDELGDFAAAHHLDEGDDLHQHADIQAEIERVIDEANEAVSKAESVREFRILPRDFSEDEGELTHTMKLRRRDIKEHFDDEIESVYAESG